MKLERADTTRRHFFFGSLDYKYGPSGGALKFVVRTLIRLNTWGPAAVIVAVWNIVSADQVHAWFTC